MDRIAPTSSTTPTGTGQAMDRISRLNGQDEKPPAGLACPVVEAAIFLGILSISLASSSGPEPAHILSECSSSWRAEPPPALLAPRQITKQTGSLGLQ